MTLKTIAPQIALHKVFLKETLLKPQLNQFKTQLDALFKELDIAQKGKEGENFQKLIIRDFLQNHSFQQFKINLKDNKDLVIYSGDSTDLPISVLFEVKKPNSSEMMTADKPNTKALQQLIFYYLDERVRSKTLAIKHLIITDIYNWYLFDENLFDKYFFRNPQWVAAYKNYKANKKRTEDFFSYAAQLLDELPMELECAYFNLEDFKNAADTDLIPLYKILSPTHLLKLPLANDSNQLDKNFYAELLHIIGLEEVKDGAKKIIRRKAKPDEYTLLENAITKLQQRGLRKVENIQKWGNTQEDQIFNIALELSLTWVNRILFLKLLEAQLIAYHRGQRGYAFLHSELIYDYPRLNTLFFEVLAQRPQNRTRDIRIEFENIPYLNSSLFELTELEDNVLQISQLDNTKRSDEFLKLDKTYKFTVKLGEISDTGDTEGEITAISPKIPTKNAILSITQAFIGEINQVPPQYSAIKVDGVRAYKAARIGQIVEIQPRKVTINSLKLLDYSYPFLTLEADVSSGTYIRSLAEDIGSQLKTGAYCTEIIRTRISDKHLKDAITLD